MNHRTLPLAAMAVALFTTAGPRAAEAGIDACGNIEVAADAQCEVLVDGGCTSRCEPVNFTATCYADCSGQCNLTAEASCTGSCSADCVGSCQAEPGNFDCNASCEARCDADCDATCGTDESCRASCQATCSGECGASCEGTAPSASCEAKCSASCDGSCSADANLDCQASCQGDCAAELTGGCEAECESPEGALFCDGQYVDHGGNLDACVAALRSLLDIEVDVSATGAASCNGGRCTADGQLDASCTTAAPGGSTRDEPWLSLGLLLGLATLTRKRIRSPR